MDLRQTVHQLQELNEQFNARIETLEEVLAERDRLIERLKSENKHLIRQLFGRKSDVPSDEAQMLLSQIIEGLSESGPDAGEDAGEDAGKGLEVKAHRRKPSKKPSGRKLLPDHLDREVVVVDLPEEDQIDSETGQKLTLIGYDESEQLIEEPAKIRVLVFKRAKYALPVQAQGGDRPGVVSAPLPPQYRGPIDRCKVAVSVLATIIVLKYCYHMTLYRLQERYWRLGRVWMARSTMCGWVQGCALALEPLYKLMIQEMFMHGYLGFDDTGVKMLNPKGGTTTTARFWSYSGLTLEAPYQIYDFRLDRSMEGPLKFLRGFKGKVIGDELSTNKGVVKRMGIELAGCWDHARRYFVDACDEDARTCAHALAFIKRLYKIEKEVPIDKVSAKERERTRKEKSAPILAEFLGWLEENKDKHLPKSGVTGAIRYALNHWTELNAYVEDGNLPISNCLCEQSFKAIATGRKNWLFVGSEEGGRSAAILFSITMTCRRLDIDPQKYLEDVLRRINDHPASRLEELLPDRWKQAQLECGQDTSLRLEDHRPLRRAS